MTMGSMPLLTAILLLQLADAGATQRLAACGPEEAARLRGLQLKIKRAIGELRSVGAAA